MPEDPASKGRPSGSPVGVRTIGRVVETTKGAPTVAIVWFGERIFTESVRRILTRSESPRLMTEHYFGHRVTLGGDSDDGTKLATRGKIGDATDLATAGKVSD